MIKFRMRKIPHTYILIYFVEIITEPGITLKPTGSSDRSALITFDLITWRVKLGVTNPAWHRNWATQWNCKELRLALLDDVKKRNNSILGATMITFHNNTPGTIELRFRDLALICSKIKCESSIEWLYGMLISTKNYWNKKAQIVFSFLNSFSKQTTRN